MSGTGEKGDFSADIPPSVLEEALRSVEKHEAPSEGPSPVPVAVEVEEPAGPEAKLEAAEKKAREALERLAEEHERYVRAVADLENYKKRSAREREELQKFAVERLVKDLLPAVDNLERALAAAPPNDPLSSGVRLVLRQIEEAFARHEVRPRSALGELFDPSLHEALLNVEAPDRPPGTVVAEQGRAWLLRGRLLRPAMVAVAAGARNQAAAPSKAAAGPPEGQGD